MLPELEFGIGDWVTIESKVLKTDPWKSGHVWTDRMSGLVIEIDALAKTEHNTIRATGYISLQTLSLLSVYILRQRTLR